jgi:hypothetical protein
MAPEQIITKRINNYKYKNRYVLMKGYGELEIQDDQQKKEAPGNYPGAS